MAETLRVNITGDSSDLTRALFAAVASLNTAAAAMSRHNSSIAKDTEKTAKRVKHAWYDAETGLIDFRRTSATLASAISTTRGGPINSLTRGLGNVVMWSGRFADTMQRALVKLLPASNAGEKAAGVFGDLGVSMSNLLPVIGALLGVLSTLSISLLALPAVIGGVVFAFTALLEAATVLGAGLLALAAPVTVVVGLLGGLGAAFAYVTAQSIKNKATQEDVHNNLLKLHVAQQTYNADVKKYGKNSTEAENALIALRKAQDTYEMSQLGVALSTAKIQDKFHSLIQTLSGRFAPTIKSLVTDAGQALTYLNKVAKLPLGQAFKSLSTTGITGITQFIQKVGFMLAKPFRLAIKFGFGVGGDTLSTQVKALYSELTNFLTGPRGALNPVVSWFHRQDFTETGLRWAHEIIHGLVGLWNRDKAFSNSVKTILSDAGHVAGHAFATTLKWEISQIFGWLKSSGVGGFALFGAAIVVALSPVITAFRNIGLAAKAVWLAVGRVVTMLTEASVGMDTAAASGTAAAVGLDAEAASATAAAEATTAVGEAAIGATTSTKALSYAAVEASGALDGVAVSADGAGASIAGAEGAGGAGLFAGLADGAAASLGPIAAVGAALTAVVLIARGASIGPFGKTNKGGFAPVEIAQMKRDGVTQQQVLHAVAQSAVTAGDDIDRARTASDRLFNSLNKLKDAKLSLKTDKINLQLDELAVKEDKANLKNLLANNGSPLEIQGARLQIKQAKAQVQADKQITLPYDKAQIKAAAGFISKQLGVIRNSYRDVFRASTAKEFNLHPLESAQKALQNSLNRTHGSLIKAATGAVEYSRRIAASNPAQAQFKLHVAAMALAVDNLTQKIGHAPSQKQINIYYKNNLSALIKQAQALGSAIDHLQSKALSITTTYTSYHVNSGPGVTTKSHKPAEAGANVLPDVPRMVGERGPELFVPGASGTILPHAETAKIVRAATEAMSGGLPGAAKDKSARNTYDLAAIRKTMHQMWNFVGGRFFPGYKEPHADFSNRIDTKFFTDAAGEGWNNSKGLRGVLLNPYYVDWLSQKMPLQKKYWKSAADDFHLVLHEWAHAFQNKQTYKKRSLVEGGAEAFSTRILDAVMGSLGMHGSFPKDIAPAYRNFYNTALKQGPEWTLFGQFQHKRYHTHKTLEKYIHGHFHNKHQHDDDGGPPHAPPPPIGLPPIAPLEGGMGPYMHRYGGNAWPGQISLVGEDGPELRREYSPARYTPALDTKRAMGGGEVHNHFHFPNAVIVDAKSIENAARLVKPSLDRMAGRR